MAGISSRAANSLENRHKFNGGTELNNSFDISLYETDFRLYDPQIGRFAQADPLADDFEDWSPYVFANDNPILLNDPLGLANDTTGRNPTPHPELNVTVTAKAKPRTIQSGISIINSPGTGVQNNPNYNPFTTASATNSPYRTFQSQCAPGCTLHQHVGIQMGDYFVEGVTFFVPAGRVFKGVKWLFSLRKARQVLGIAKLLHASKFGIGSYKSLKAINSIAGTQVHHLIEKRFASLLGQNADDMLSIVVTQSEHQVFTNAWRAEIGYNGSKSVLTTGAATLNDVENAARKIYKDYPDILKALGL